MCPDVLQTSEEDLPLDELELRVADRTWTVQHIGAVITRELEDEFVRSGGSSKKPTPTPAKPLGWKDMDAKQREGYMKDVVLPKAKALFVAFDPKYQTMDCVTCHGDGAADGSALR